MKTKVSNKNHSLIWKTHAEIACRNAALKTHLSLKHDLGAFLISKSIKFCVLKSYILQREK